MRILTAWTKINVATLSVNINSSQLVFATRLPSCHKRDLSALLPLPSCVYLSLPRGKFIPLRAHNRWETRDNFAVKFLALHIPRIPPTRLSARRMKYCEFSRDISSERIVDAHFLIPPCVLRRYVIQDGIVNRMRFYVSTFFLRYHQVLFNFSTMKKREISRLSPSLSQFR